jgi:hypothetical protein
MSGKIEIGKLLYQRYAQVVFHREQFFLPKKVEGGKVEGLKFLIPDELDGEAVTYYHEVLEKGPGKIIYIYVDQEHRRYLSRWEPVNPEALVEFLSKLEVRFGRPK